MELRSWLNRDLVVPVDELRVQGQVLPQPMYEMARIHFPTGSAALGSQDREVLNQLALRYAGLLGTLPRPLVMAFIGMADPRGADRKNVVLSQQRAQATADCFRQALAAARPGDAPGASLLVDGRGEASAAEMAEVTNLAPDEALAHWRRVSVYANLPPQWLEAAIRRIPPQVREMAERALRRMTEARTKLHSCVEALRQKTANTAGKGVYAFNFSDLVDTQLEMEHYERRLEELKLALDAGTEAFLAWQKDRRPAVERYREMLGKLQEECRRLRPLAEHAGEGAGQPELREVIEFLTAEIESIEEYVRLIEEGKVTD